MTARCSLRIASPMVAVIGGGPAGLMAAEALISSGLRVDVYDAMASVGRKFLLAGKGGLNLTHAEPLAPFIARFGATGPQLLAALGEFSPGALRDWARGLGVETFAGSSRRVFPADRKAAPLLRAWLHRLREAGVQFHTRHRWLGWDAGGALRFAVPGGAQSVSVDAVVLALGGASWPQLGADGAWVPLLQQRGVLVEGLQPANCGFDVGWSAHFRDRFAGYPVKSVAVTWRDRDGSAHRQQGEFTVTATGVEGSLIYAASTPVREQIAAAGVAVIHLDLAPDRNLARVVRELSRPRGSRTLASHLRRQAGIDGVKAGLLREVLGPAGLQDPGRVGTALKALPLMLVAARPLAEAISTAGGVAFAGLDQHLMIRNLPGIFCAGEMLDWEAPTGGYLLTACFATGRAAGLGAAAWLRGQADRRPGKF